MEVHAGVAPPSNVGTNGKIVEMTEDAVTLENLFKHIYPKRMVVLQGQEKTQCSACGLVSTKFTKLVCNDCIKFYKSQTDVPMEIIKLPGIMDLLVGDKDAASDHQQRASNTRLAMGPPASTAPSGLNKFKNLGAVHKLRAEQGAKKAKAALVEQKRGIKITVTLWALALGHKRMDTVGQICVSHIFEDSVQLKATLEKLLERVVSEFQVLYPDARQLSW
ncbi:hypothetical protein H0H87_011862 [Tephrocybe sp. NHM501043]|nr:hypothetical protein H0H87_011862 [Tephrocybe sp. NHM501043]